MDSPRRTQQAVGAALLWFLVALAGGSGPALAAFENEEIVASVASLWELSLKLRKKNALVANLVPWRRKYVTDKGVFTLSIRTGRRDRALLAV